jgi:hypothetical protein
MLQGKIFYPDSATQQGCHAITFFVIFLVKMIQNGDDPPKPNRFGPGQRADGGVGP